jgi:hypothetical protein
MISTRYWLFACLDSGTVPNFCLIVGGAGASDFPLRREAIERDLIDARDRRTIDDRTATRDTVALRPF